MEPLWQLELALPPAGSRQRGAALHRLLRTAILEGRLAPGLRLPSTRRLAETLGVSRNLVLAAYDLLLAEGYLSGRRGAGTYVAAALPARPAAPRFAGGPDLRLAPAWRDSLPVLISGPAAPRWDLRLGLPDARLFPHETWRRLAARAWRELERRPAGYGDPQGAPALRAALAQHASFTRAVACGPLDIVTTAGAQQAFDLVAKILVTPGETLVALEDPGYPPLRRAFAAAGARFAAVPVDAEGLVVEHLPAAARLVCVTPSHQFPLGVALSARRRAALLDWAAARGAAILEDDYDGEYRYGGRPLDALQTLDRRQSVFYVGTVSKTLLPALRLGFVVAPPWARAALAGARQAADWQGPAAMEETLAAFIAGGHMARHVRRSQRLYARRRELLLQALEKHCGAWLSPLPALAGLHLAARLAPGLDAAAIVEQAAERGLALEHLGRYGQEATVSGLAFGFGQVDEAAIEPAIRTLATLLAAAPGS